MLTLLENLFRRRRPLKPTKGSRAPGAPKDGAGIRMTSDWARVTGLIGEIGAGRILIHGDAAALKAAKAALPGRDLLWASHHHKDLDAGAALAEDVDWRSVTAAICTGGELPGRYRQALRLMAAADASQPVFWVGEGFEFCGGTLSAPMEADEVEGLLFNHFQEFFGIKDALQFRIEVYHGSEVKRHYRILEPNQSIVVRLSDLVPQRRHAVSLAAFVEHPVLTRERHYRLRLCADIFWRDSFTTLHSAHEFGRSPTHKVEFRVPAWLVREGEVALTIPNFERNAESEHQIETVDGRGSRHLPRDTGSYLQQAKISRNGEANETFLGWRYRGYGGSNWFTLETEGALTSGHKGSISGNHHVSCPIVDRGDFAASDEELARLKSLAAEGYLLEPYALPLAPLACDLEFGYDSDAANPAQPHLRIDYFGAGGDHLGRHDMTKTKAGPLFARDLVAAWNDPAAARAALAFVSNDFAKAGLRTKGFKPMANLVVRNLRTQDRDFTEFQSCWRNLGSAVPGFPHWLTDHLAVIGRTNVFGRVRCDRGLRTGVLIVHGSGRLGYRGRARVEFIALNNEGRRLSSATNVPAFTARFTWLDEVIPTLAAHLGESGNGALLVQSADADLNCQIVTTSPGGAVALQHLWGY